MFDSLVRDAKERVQQPLANKLAYVHPTMVTILAFIVGLVGAAAVIEHYYALGLVLWLLNRILDGFDGTLARVQQRQSDLGGYIDILLDFAIYAIMPIALVIGNPSPNNYLALAFLLSTFYVNAASWMYLSGILEKRSQNKPSNQYTTVNMPNGLIAGTETVVFYCIFIVFSDQLVFLFSTMGIFIMVTVIQRLVWATQNLD